MRYIKTYERWQVKEDNWKKIKNFFIPARFPKEVFQLSKELTKFIENNLQGYKAGVMKYKGQGSSPGSLSIYVHPRINMDSSFIYIDIRYNPNLKLIILYINELWDSYDIFFAPNVDSNIRKKISDFTIFFNEVFSKYKTEKKITSTVRGLNFWFEPKVVPEIIEELTNQNFDLYLNTAKYNL